MRENVRRHDAEQKERQTFLLYLLQSAGTAYREVSQTYKMELAALTSQTAMSKKECGGTV